MVPEPESKEDSMNQLNETLDEVLPGKKEDEIIYENIDFNEIPRSES